MLTPVIYNEEHGPGRGFGAGCREYGSNGYGYGVPSTDPQHTVDTSRKYKGAGRVWNNDPGRRVFDFCPESLRWVKTNCRMHFLKMFPDFRIGCTVIFMSKFSCNRVPLHSFRP